MAVELGTVCDNNYVYYSLVTKMKCACQVETCGDNTCWAVTLAERIFYCSLNLNSCANMNNASADNQYAE